MQDTESEEDGFGSLPLNLSSVPFTGRFEPGCGQKKKGCQVIILLSQTSTYCTKESGRRNMWNFGSCMSLLTARSSSSELKRLSRSFMDTTKSVSWMRLVEAIRLWAAPRWASAQQYLVLTSRDLRYGSSQFHLKEMNTEWTLHKAIKYFLLKLILMYRWFFQFSHAISN